MVKSKKPLIGVGTIILSGILAGSGYLLSRDPLIAAILAGLPTFIAPAYYAWKMDPVKSLAAGVLASMISGGVTWLIVSWLGGTPRTHIDPVIAMSTGILSGGVGSHLSASAYFMDLLDGVSGGNPNYPIAAAGFLASCSSTVIGLAIIRSIRRPRDLASPSLLLIILLALSLLAVIAASGGV